MLGFVLNLATNDIIPFTMTILVAELCHTDLSASLKLLEIDIVNKKLLFDKFHDNLPPSPPFDPQES